MAVEVSGMQAFEGSVSKVEVREVDGRRCVVLDLLESDGASLVAQLTLTPDAAFRLGVRLTAASTEARLRMAGGDA